MAIEWTRDIELGVDRIDNQHKELIALINKVFDACSLGEGKQTVGDALNFAVSYTLVHFKSEEDLMRERNYPEYVNHKPLHEEFIRDISALKSEFDKAGPTISIVLKLNRLLVDWLIKHIKTEDRKIANFLKSRGQAEFIE